MWIRRIKQAVFVVCALLIVGAAALTWLWSDRPRLDTIDWPEPAIAGTVDADEVTVTWLGVTTLLFDDGETQILIDGFFSRPSLADVLLDRPLENDAVTINFALYEYRMRRLAAVVPVHSHFDHAMDVGAIANRTSASVLGSASTAEIARGAGVPEDQITVVETEKPYQFGRFTLTFLASKHAPVGWRGSVPYAGTINAPLKMPQPPSAWRDGGCYTVVIDHPEGTAIVQGSAGFNRDTGVAVAADVVMLGIGGLGSLGKDYSEHYWQALVTSTGAHSVYPIHFDDYTRPFGEIVPGPRFLGDLETTAGWLEEFRRKWDTDARLFLPEFGRPMAIYSSSDPLPET